MQPKPLYDFTCFFVFICYFIYILIPLLSPPKFYILCIFQELGLWLASALILHFEVIDITKDGESKV